MAVVLQEPRVEITITTEAILDILTVRRTAEVTLLVQAVTMEEVLMVA